MLFKASFHIKKHYCAFYTLFLESGYLCYLSKYLTEYKPISAVPPGISLARIPYPALGHRCSQARNAGRRTGLFSSAANAARCASAKPLSVHS